MQAGYPRSHHYLENEGQHLIQLVNLENFEQPAWKTRDTVDKYQKPQKNYTKRLFLLKFYRRCKLCHKK